MPGTPTGQPRAPMSVLADRSKSTWLNKRYVRIGSVCLFAVALLSLLATNSSELLSLAGHAWSVSDPMHRADAAVILGGGFETRPAAAAQLYKNGDVREILVSTAGDDLTGMIEPENRALLITLGIPASAIGAFGNHPSNTYEEARALALWAEHNGVHRLIVPTEIFPSRRVQWILRQELSKIHVDVRVETMTPTFYNFDNWWKHRSGLSNFSSEIMKYLYYRIRYWHS
jgi:uncharacterized SAM-binding protein YcdF (DUF218 family)